MQPTAQSRLATGDVAAFDSRLLHCGCANDSATPRALFYGERPCMHALLLLLACAPLPAAVRCR